MLSDKIENENALANNDTDDTIYTIGSFVKDQNAQSDSNPDATENVSNDEYTLAQGVAEYVRLHPFDTTLDIVKPTLTTDDNPDSVTTTTTDEEIKKMYSNISTAKTFSGSAVLQDSGNREQFVSGAVRDIQETKGDEYLLPFEEVGKLLVKYIRDHKDSCLIKNEMIPSRIAYYLNNYKNTGDILSLYDILNTIIEEVYDGDTPEAMMQLAIHFKNGAEKYAPRNWELGMPVSNYISSFCRHFFKYIRGDKDEPHERAMMWNIICAIWTIREHPELNDFCLAKKTKESDSNDSI